MNILPKTRNSTQCTIEKPRPRLSNNRPWLLLCLTSLLISCSDQQHSTSDSATLPYAIGSSTRFIHDESRPFDTVAGVNLGIRTLIIELWYPCLLYISEDADDLRGVYSCLHLTRTQQSTKISPHHSSFYPYY